MGILPSPDDEALIKLLESRVPPQQDGEQNVSKSLWSCWHLIWEKKIDDIGICQHFVLYVRYRLSSITNCLTNPIQSADKEHIYYEITV